LARCATRPACSPKSWSLLDELRFGGYILYEENENGNPYGNLVLTPAGAALLDGAEENVQGFMLSVPKQYKVSAPERSTRRGGKRNAEVPPTL
jgi:hypothetical protein